VAARADGAALFVTIDLASHRSIAIPKSAQLLLTVCSTSREFAFSRARIERPLQSILGIRSTIPARRSKSELRKSLGPGGLCQTGREASGLLAFGDAGQAQPPVEMLALCEVHRVVAGRSGAESGDGEIGYETLGDRTDLGCLGEQSGKSQCTG
jgi:hypothetical protein